MNGKRLKTLRERLGITQDELAERVKVSSRTIMRYEREEPDDDTLRLLAITLNVSSDYLLGLTDDPTPVNDELDPQSSELIAAYNRGDFARALEIITTGMKQTKVSA